MEEPPPAKPRPPMHYVQILVPPSRYPPPSPAQPPLQFATPQPHGYHSPPRALPSVSYAQPPPPTKPTPTTKPGPRPSWPASLPAHSLRLTREYAVICNTPEVQSKGIIGLADFKVLGEGIVLLHKKIESMYRGLWERAGEEARKDVGWDWIAECDGKPMGLHHETIPSHEKRSGLQARLDAMHKAQSEAKADEEWMFDGVRWKAGNKRKKGNKSQKNGPEEQQSENTNGRHRVQSGSTSAGLSSVAPPVGMFSAPARQKYVETPIPLPVVKKRKKKTSISMDDAQKGKSLDPGTHDNASSLPELGEKPKKKHKIADEIDPALVTAGVIDRKKRGRRRKSEKVRDPNAPKHPTSAFLYFNSTENRKKIRDENPEMDFKNVGASMGELWRTMPEAEREVYLKMAKVDKQRYDDEKAVYKRRPATASTYVDYAGDDSDSMPGRSNFKTVM